MVCPKVADAVRAYSIEGSCVCIEQTVVEKQQGMDLQLAFGLGANNSP